MNILHFSCLLFTYSIISSPLIYAQDVCVQKSPCICEFANGTGMDISATEKVDFYSARTYKLLKNNTEYELSTYMFHPCKNLVPTVITQNTTCNQPLSVYRLVNTMVLKNDTANSFVVDAGRCDYLGNTNTSKFSNNGNAIEFYNVPSKTTVLLFCTESDDQMHIISLDEPNSLVLGLYSRSACFKKISDYSRSLGSTLLIIFFSCVIFYLVLGVGTKKFLMGATGIEVIPNLAFWSDLPNLVKDGWSFARNGFKLPARGAPAMSPDPNSYDSI